MSRWTGSRASGSLAGKRRWWCAPISGCTMLLSPHRKVLISGRKRVRRSCSGIATAGLVGALLLSACTSDSLGATARCLGQRRQSTPVDEPHSRRNGPSLLARRVHGMPSSRPTTRRWLAGRSTKSAAAPIWATGQGQRESRGIFPKYFPAPTWQAQSWRSSRRTKRLRSESRARRSVQWSQRRAHQDWRNGGLSVDHSMRRLPDC